MQRARSEIKEFARSKHAVLIQGETGTGKELAAQSIAALSRWNRLTVVNCGVLAGMLFDTEVFGHLKGAFTGAVRDRAGLLRTADGGTLFMDELADLTLEAQAKLIRFVETGEFRRVGSDTVEHSNVRIITATNTPIDVAVAKGIMRADFRYRIESFVITMPSLRERPEDILPIARSFLDKQRRINPLLPGSISSEAAALLASYDWPGNVRQLEGVLGRSISKAGPCRRLEADPIAELLGERFSPAAEVQGMTMNERVRRTQLKAVAEVLARTGGNHEKARSILDISRATWYRLLRDLGYRHRPNGRERSV